MQEADPVCGISGAHGRHETTEVRDVHRTDGGRGLRRGQGKERNCAFWMTSELSISTLISERLRTGTRGNGARRQDKEQGAEHFKAKMNAVEKTMKSWVTR